MNTQMQNELLCDFLLNLECLGTAGQRDAFMIEITQSGGSYVPPDGDTWSSHLFEISLHGVCACGFSEDEAMRNWIKAARSVARMGDDESRITDRAPFPKPRNHGEEIANARAAAEGAL